MSDQNIWMSRAKEWLASAKETATEAELKQMAELLKTDYYNMVAETGARTNTPRESTVPDTLEAGRAANALEVERQLGLQPVEDQRAGRQKDALTHRTRNKIDLHGAVTNNLTNASKSVMGGTHMDGIREGLDHSRYAIDTEAGYRSARDDKYLQAIQGDQALRRQALQMAGNQTTMDFISKLGLGALMLAG